jgi:hypothetical protein
MYGVKVLYRELTLKCCDKPKIPAVKRLRFSSFNQWFEAMLNAPISDFSLLE